MKKEEAAFFLRKVLEQRLNISIWDIHEEDDSILISQKGNEASGFKLSLPSTLAKLNQGEEEEGLLQAAEKLAEMAQASLMEKTIRGNEERIYPVLRSASHPKDKQGVGLVYQEHTAESNIFYALDLGKTYVLIDEQVRQQSGYQAKDIHDLSIANLKKLDTTYKMDQVAGNTFYFFSQRDGYAASRVLNDELLLFMQRKMTKEMGIAIPHQDVLIIADLQNETGYKVLSRMNMDFCMKGDIPVSPLSFVFSEQGLEPIMVVSNPGAAPKQVRKK